MPGWHNHQYLSLVIGLFEDTVTASRFYEKYLRFVRHSPIALSKGYGQSPKARPDHLITEKNLFFHKFLHAVLK
jgi:hypothetical protein